MCSWGGLGRGIGDRCRQLRRGVEPDGIIPLAWLIVFVLLLICSLGSGDLGDRNGLKRWEILAFGRGSWEMR